MGKIVPDAVERYLASLNRSSDALLHTIADQGRADDLPLVDAEVGALLQVLALSIGAEHVLEIGTAIGYSTIWLARGLTPTGRLISFEIDPGRATTAKANLERAGLTERVSIMRGNASVLVAKVSGPFDLIFNDGDKAQYGPLHDRLVALLRPGGLLVTDNVLWDGEVVPGYTTGPSRSQKTTDAISSYNERLSSDPRLMTSWIPLRDGLAIAVRRS